MVKGKSARVVGDTSVDPGNFAATIEKVLDMRPETTLGLDKCVVGVGKNDKAFRVHVPLLAPTHR